MLPGRLLRVHAGAASLRLSSSLQPLSVPLLLQGRLLRQVWARLQRCFLQTPTRFPNQEGQW